MVHQATLTHGNGHVGASSGSPVTGFLGGIGDLGNNIVTLATLQTKLAAYDTRESFHQAIPGLIALAVAVPLAIAGVTAGVFGLAFWLSALTGMASGYSLLIMAILALAATGILAIIAIGRLQTSFAHFRRSKEELERNVAWLGTVLKQSGR